jgi:hypothetical protein
MMARMQGALVVVVTPKPEFAEWIGGLMDFLEVSLPNTPSNKTEKSQLDWLFVMPIQVDGEACLHFIKEHYQEIFEDILSTWDTDKRLWPKEMSYSLFEKYFSINFHSALYDLSATV